MIWEVRYQGCSGDCHKALLQRLLRDLEHVAVDLGKFIQEEHPVVRRRHYVRHGDVLSHGRQGRGDRRCETATLCPTWGCARRRSGPTLEREVGPRAMPGRADEAHGCLPGRHHLLLRAGR
jgi:hypothetical protein